MPQQHHGYSFQTPFLFKTEGQKTTAHTPATGEIPHLQLSSLRTESSSPGLLLHLPLKVRREREYERVLPPTWPHVCPCLRP